MATVTNTKAPTTTACQDHPAYEADNCPQCGTAQKIGANGPTTTKRTRKVSAAAAATKKPATAKAPAKATKSAAKVEAKAPAKTKAPAKRSTTKAPTHPGATWAALLEEKGLSQSEAARQMGIAPMTLNRLINGHGIPTANVAIRFAQVTGRDVRTVWSEVADYELALALSEAK